MGLLKKMSTKISKALTAAFLVLVPLNLMGCANEGSTILKEVTEAEAERKITVGKTTRDEVRTMFGSPLETKYTDSGLEIWTYQYDDTTGLNAENIASLAFTLGLAGTKQTGDRKELVVLFDENNVVKRYNMSQSPVTKGTGIF
jgi:outer membrane protein assembly factor BamE (lipoprotein component of BamABCDE complex)